MVTDAPQPAPAARRAPYAPGPAGQQPTRVTEPVDYGSMGAATSPMTGGPRPLPPPAAPAAPRPVPNTSLGPPQAGMRPAGPWSALPISQKSPLAARLKQKLLPTPTPMPASLDPIEMLGQQGAAGGGAPTRLGDIATQSDEARDALADLPNRYDLAQQRFKTFAEQTDPAFQASLREAAQLAAAKGGLGSGMLTSSYGDVAAQRARELQGERDTIFQNALEGSIGDAYQKASVLGSLENQEFARRMGMTQEEAALKAQEFQQNLQRATFLTQGKNQTAALLAEEQAQQSSNQMAQNAGNLLQYYALNKAPGGYVPPGFHVDPQTGQIVPN
jgi:hypothetical protein